MLSSEKTTLFGMKSKPEVVVRGLYAKCAFSSSYDIKSIYFTGLWQFDIRLNCNAADGTNLDLWRDEREKGWEEVAF